MLLKLLAKIPSHIRITPKVTYEIVFIEDFADGKTCGECRYNTKQIVIKKGQSATETFKTVLHEILHAVALENEFELTEKQVRALEESLFRLMKINKWLALIAKIL